MKKTFHTSTSLLWTPTCFLPCWRMLSASPIPSEGICPDSGAEDILTIRFEFAILSRQVVYMLVSLLCSSSRVLHSRHKQLTSGTELRACKSKNCIGGNKPISYRFATKGAGPESRYDTQCVLKNENYVAFWKSTTNNFFTRDEAE